MNRTHEPSPTPVPEPPAWKAFPTRRRGAILLTGLALALLAGGITFIPAPQADEALSAKRIMKTVGLELHQAEAGQRVLVPAPPPAPTPERSPSLAEGECLPSSVPETPKEMPKADSSSVAAGVTGTGYAAAGGLNTVRIQRERSNTEAYKPTQDNAFHAVAQDPLSTFSIDVDTASYANLRRFLNEGQLPPKDAVRIEEMVNYFTFAYPAPTGPHPFSVSADLSACPWNGAHRLLRVALQGRRFQAENRPGLNLVFLVDVSGSMQDRAKLPLVKEGLRGLAGQLGAQDRVALVVYAGSSGLVLPPTSGDRKGEILSALDRLEAGGSTNGAEGIRLAYRVAEGMRRPGAQTRVVLATDGDFNVGTTSEGELVSLIEAEREKNVFLSILGYGYGNLKDSTLEAIADKGNGLYAYVDSRAESRRVLDVQKSGTLYTIAQDVKLQLEFNPARVQGYRLIGYENRVLAHQDFNDDRKDAGDLGAGHSVTALYEVVPAGAAFKAPSVDPLKYQQPREANRAEGEWLTVKLRYKEPEGHRSRLLVQAVTDRPELPMAGELAFAASVAAFGMVLRDSPHKGRADFALVRRLAEGSLGEDAGGWRREFLGLVARAEALRPVRSARRSGAADDPQKVAAASR